MRDRSSYWRERYLRDRVDMNLASAKWRTANAARVKAHDRLRYLVRKSDPSDGEIEQMMEIAAKYPKRRIVL